MRLWAEKNAATGMERLREEEEARGEIIGERMDALIDYLISRWPSG